jgi:hypothetical protein
MWLFLGSWSRTVHNWSYDQKIRSVLLEMLSQESLDYNNNGNIWRKVYSIAMWRLRRNPNRRGRWERRLSVAYGHITNAPLFSDFYLFTAWSLAVWARFIWVSFLYILPVVLQMAAEHGWLKWTDWPKMLSFTWMVIGKAGCCGSLSCNLSNRLAERSSFTLWAGFQLLPIVQALLNSTRIIFANFSKIYLLVSLKFICDHSKIQ